MDYGSVCSGIEAATVAWHPLGWKAVWFSEIEPFPCNLLKHYYPQVPNLGDMLTLIENEKFQQCPIDILVGGTPCQSFSIAGLRGGLSDDRGNLALQYCRLLVAKRPRWFIWENVPGALSSFSNSADGPDMEGSGPGNGQYITETSDFAAILAAFRECGYSCAYRVLDAQYCGVPQRRRRVFVVGYFGDDWRPPAAVLFEPESLRGNFKTGKKTGQEIAGTLDAVTKGGDFPDSDGAMNGHIVATLDASYGRLQGASNQDAGHGHSLLIAQPMTFMPGQGLAAGSIAFGEVSPTLRSANSGTNMVPAVVSDAVAYPYNQITSKANRSNPQSGDPAPSLTGSGQIMIVPAVRRLTPLECERLQGFPDYYTNIPGASDTARYQSIGNSMAVPVMRWLGHRIDILDKFLQKNG